MLAVGRKPKSSLPRSHSLTLQGLIDGVRVQLWLGLPILILLVWLLVTYTVFPANVTDRHYLSVAPVIGFVCITVIAPRLQCLISDTKLYQVAFIVPSDNPRECYNEITPNDMRNDARCALMGVILFFGAWLVVLSCQQYLRCWNREPLC